jgi:hypothetical protein
MLTNKTIYVGIDNSFAVNMKSAVFWDMARVGLVKSGISEECVTSTSDVELQQLPNGWNHQHEKH